MLRQLKSRDTVGTVMAAEDQSCLRKGAEEDECEVI